MQIHSLSLDVFEEEYSLIGIHTTLEDYKLAYILNKRLGIKLGKCRDDLKFEEIDTIDKYHDDVLTYKVTDSKGDFIAIFYADYFPRSGKRNGAWMTVYKPQYIKNGKNSRPHISIVCNFTKPTKTKPSLSVT